MSNQKPTYQELEARLSRAEEILEVLGNGEVDAIIGKEHISLVSLKEAEAALRESERRYRQLFRSLGDAVMVYSSQGRFVDCSESVLQQYGYTRDEFLCLEATDIVHPDFHPVMKDNQKKIWAGENIIVESAHRCKDGKVIHVETNACKIKYKGEPAILAVVRDITEQKRRDKSLREINQLLETVLNSTHMLVAYLDPQFNFVRVNRAYAEASELEPSFFPGKNHFDLYPNAENEEIFRRVVETGEPYFVSARPFEFAEHPERGVTYWDWSLIPVKDSAEAVAGLVLTVMDVTERQREKEELKQHRENLKKLVEEQTSEIKRTNEQLRVEIKERKQSEKALKKREHFIQRITDTIPDIIYIYDLIEQRIVYVNNPLPTIPGYTPEAWQSMGERMIEILVHPDDYESVVEHMEKLTSDMDGGTFENEYRIKRANGEWCWLRSRDTVFSRTDEGLPKQILGIATDITERKQSEEARIVAERQLEEQRALSMRTDRLRSLGEMAAGIAHELNQPLVGVRGLAEQILIGMQRGWEITEEEFQEDLNLIIQQADRMSHIIEHVRIFAREAGKPELSSVQVNDVVKSAMDMLRAQLKSRGIELEFELAEDLPTVMANPFSLEEVVLNLIINARDAVEERQNDGSSSAPSRVLLRTFLESKNEAQHVKIEVTDWGVGIPEDILPKVLDPFFTTKEPQSGTGLGLSISQSLVEQVGGTIQIESELNQGTKVIISLPDSHDFQTN